MLWCRWTDFQSICLLLFLDKDSWLSWMRELEQPWEIMMTYSLRLMWRDKVELGSNLHLSLRCASPFRAHALWLSVVRRIGRVQGCLPQPTTTKSIQNLLERLENNETAAYQIRTLKTTTFTESPTTDMLILAAAAQNLCLWSCLVCSAAPYLTSLCLSLCEPSTSLLLLSFPPRPRRPRVCSLEVGLWGGWGGGVYMVGATLWCPHHWLLWIWRVRRYECVTSNNSLCLAL